MKDIYYFLAIVPFAIEFYTVSNPKKVHNFWKNLKGVKGEDMSSTQRIVGVGIIFYMVWAFIGLLSSQWVFFGLLFTVSIMPLKKFIVLRWIDSLICLGIILFIIINAYHLKIDVFKLIASLI
jgi:hypothetical protein